MCMVCMPGPCGSQMETLDPLEVGLVMIISHLVGTGNLTQVLFKISKGLLTFKHLSNALQSTSWGNNKHIIFKRINLLAWWIWQRRLRLFEFLSGHLKYHFKSHERTNLSTLATESMDIHSEYVSQHNSSYRTTHFLNLWTKLQKKENGLASISITHPVHLLLSH